MDFLIVVLILVALFGGFGGFYTSQPNYAGPGAGLSNILYLLVVVALIVIVLRFLGVVRL